jgi:ribosomal-protein-alanine N-acetyltransferase
MNKLICRTAIPSDIRNIMLLESACFNKFTQESESVYLERIECFSEGFMILEDKENFIGAVSSEIWTYNPVISLETFSLGHSIKQQINLSGDELYISSIGIFPEYRNKGYGKILFHGLIDNVVKKFKNLKHGILLLNKNWTYAQRIYLNIGFYNVAGFKGFFTEDDCSKSDGIVMRHDNITGIQPQVL